MAKSTIMLKATIYVDVTRDDEFSEVVKKLSMGVYDKNKMLYNVLESGDMTAIVDWKDVEVVGVLGHEE